MVYMLPTINIVLFLFLAALTNYWWSMIGQRLEKATRKLSFKLRLWLSILASFTVALLIYFAFLLFYRVYLEIMGFGELTLLTAFYPLGFSTFVFIGIGISILPFNKKINCIVFTVLSIILWCLIIYLRVNILEFRYLSDFMLKDWITTTIISIMAGLMLFIQVRKADE